MQLLILTAILAITPNLTADKRESADDNSFQINTLGRDLKGEPLQLPAGKFYLTKAVRITGGSLLGAADDAGKPATELVFIDEDQVLAQLGLVTWLPRDGQICSNLIITGNNSKGACLGPNGQLTNANGHGLILRLADNCRLSRVTVRQHRCQGFNIAGCNRLELQECWAQDCGRDGIFVAGMPGKPLRDVTVRDCRVRNVGDDGIAIWAGYDPLPRDLLAGADVRILGCDVQHRTALDKKSLGVGIRLGGIRDAQVENCLVYDTTKAGIHVMEQGTATAERISLTNSRVLRAGAYDSGQFPQQKKDAIVLPKYAWVKL